MKVLIDTNVLISAALRDKDPEAVILCVASTPDIEWVVSAPVMAEYKEVLARPKFGLSQALLLKWFQLLDELTISIDVDIEVDFLVTERMQSFLRVRSSAALSSRSPAIVIFPKPRNLSTRLLFQLPCSRS